MSDVSDGAVQASEISPQIGLVDYGVGNRRSVEKALEHVGARVHVSSDPELLREMDGLVLPGVGAFPLAMTAIRELGLDELLIERGVGGRAAAGASASGCSCCSTAPRSSTEPRDWGCWRGRCARLKPRD